MLDEEAKRPTMTLTERVLLIEKDNIQIKKDQNELGRKQRINEKSDKMIKETVDAAENKMKGSAATWKKITAAILAAYTGVKAWEYLQDLSK